MFLLLSLSSFSKHSFEGRAKYKYRVSNGLLIPYLELDIDLHALTGLTASPAIKSDLAEKSIRDYCDYTALNVDVFYEGIDVYFAEIAAWSDGFFV